MYQRGPMSDSGRHSVIRRYCVVEFVNSIKDGGTRVRRRLRLSFFFFDQAALRHPGEPYTERWLQAPGGSGHIALRNHSDCGI